MRPLGLLLCLFLTGCVGSKQSMQPGKYSDVLPTYGGVIAYRLAVIRPSYSPTVADTRTRSWAVSSGSVLSLLEQKPIVKKTDLVYLASLPARQVPDAKGDLVTVPPMRFFLTINNQSDGSKLWVTNFETAGQSGCWQALEKRGLVEDKQVQKMCLTDLDAMVTELLDSLSRYLSKG